MSRQYIGDFAVGSKVLAFFETFKSNGESISIPTFDVTDITIYKDGSATPRSSENGYVLLDSDGIDFAGIVGINGFSVDLSDDTDAGFYESGSEYTALVDSITVQGKSVNLIAAEFSIENRRANLKPGEIKTTTYTPGAIDENVLSDAAKNSIADFYLDRVSAIDGLTPRQCTALILAVACGNLSGAGTTQVTIQDFAGLETRVIATVDQFGNRTITGLGNGVFTVNI